MKFDNDFQAVIRNLTTSCVLNNKNTVLGMYETYRIPAKDGNCYLALEKLW